MACAVSRPGTSGLRASGTAPVKWDGAVPTAEHPYEVVRIGVPYPLADLLNWEMNEPSTAPGDLTGIETAQIGLYAHRGQDTRTSRIQDHPVNSCTRLSCSRTPLEGPKDSTEVNE